MRVVLNDQTRMVLRRSFKLLEERWRPGSDVMAWLVSPAFALSLYAYRSSFSQENGTERDWSILQRSLRSIVSNAVVASTPTGRILVV